MDTETAPINTGLEGVVVAATAISHVDGQRGDLSYRGRSIDYWVEQEFSRAAAAVVDWPTGTAQIDLGALLYERGKLSELETKTLLLHADKHPMRVLQAVTSLIGYEENDADAGLLVAARLPHAVATLIAGSRVSYPAEPDYAARFLAMLGHKSPSDLACRALSVVQILQLEHSLNAGTFTARVTASTQASLPAAISSALGALSGPLHGGADQAAMEMADRVARPEAARAFVADCLAEGRKIMGMGHREYKVVDPRAVHVKRLAAELLRGTPHEVTLATLCEIESEFSKAMAARKKPLHANLEFYKGPVYRALGIPDRAFTAVFAMARVFGYVAHVLESRLNSRLIRPSARYDGV